eukprot:TRINITY_DN4852_c4_g1_i1.p1 TRINITY_DN4852_c4_g1~~TRINITY_DN4852_c4_g1_i1.p1  ORF type:complete len:319 (-),score=114.95 TRINITY_DN4852_c4_g1_i1:69-1025(-)
MLIKEYIIPMPLSVEEYRMAQLYMVAKFSRERTTRGEGITIVKNEPYEDENGKGQFTHKIIHIGSSAPAWAKSLIPANCCVEEKAWNAYPYVKTVYSCPLFGDRFSIVSETRYFEDDGKEKENVFDLPPDVLATRELDRVDIVNEAVDERHYKESEDPKLWVSKINGRGKLGSDWQKTVSPKMVIHKLTKVEFRVWGFQTKVEQYLQKAMVRDIILLGHRQAFTWMDEWINLTIEEIRKYEKETKVYLDKIMNGEILPDGTPAPPKDATPKPEKKGWGSWATGWGSKTNSPAPGSPAGEKKPDDEVEETTEQVAQLGV